MQYKFQNLEVYTLSLEYLDLVYAMTSKFPDNEKYNLKSQMERAATSVVLNIAEASTGQSNPEQHRILGLSVRSYLETVACKDIAVRRGYTTAEDAQSLSAAGDQLFIKLQAFRGALKS